MKTIKVEINGVNTSELGKNIVKKFIPFDGSDSSSL